MSSFTKNNNHCRIGDIARRCDIDDGMIGYEKMSFASTLRAGDGAFLQRSDGNWRFAVVHSRNRGSESYIVFEVEGSKKKKIKQKHWCAYISAIRKRPTHYDHTSQYKYNQTCRPHLVRIPALSRTSSSCATFVEENRGKHEKVTVCNSKANSTDFSQLIKEDTNEATDTAHLTICNSKANSNDFLQLIKEDTNEATDTACLKSKAPTS